MQTYFARQIFSFSVLITAASGKGNQVTARLARQHVHHARVQAMHQHENVAQILDDKQREVIM